jgi:hypothetical protein
VTGSRQNIRPHPLIRAERELRRESAQAMDELEQVLHRLESHRKLGRVNEAMRIASSSRIGGLS